MCYLEGGIWKECKFRGGGFFQFYLNSNQLGSIQKRLSCHMLSNNKTANSEGNSTYGKGECGKQAGPE